MKALITFPAGELTDEICIYAIEIVEIEQRLEDQVDTSLEVFQTYNKLEPKNLRKPVFKLYFEANIISKVNSDFVFSSNKHVEIETIKNDFKRKLHLI